jgi:hypothetical protein
MGDVTTFSNLEEKYDKSAGAEALFFANEHNKALRVEAHTLHVEFTDGLYIGRGASSRTHTDAFAIVHGILLFHCEDPQGLLYYNNNESFDGSDLKYKVTIATNKAGKCAHIKFFHDKEENCRIEVCCILFSSINSFSDALLLR